MENINSNNNSSNKHNVKDLVVCCCDGQTVELFKTVPFKFNDLGATYDSGIIYLGLNSEQVAIKVIHHDLLELNQYTKPNFTLTTKDSTYITNCEISQEIGFEDLRFKMYKEGKFDSYEMGKATNEEINAVLSYAMNYYGVSTLTLNGVRMNDISNILVCSYNEKSVGLFSVKPLRYTEDKSSPVFGYLYTEVNSHNTGIKTIEKRPGEDSTLRNVKAGSIIETSNSEYSVDYEINDEMSFDDMRLQMYKEGMISSYLPGVASEEEVNAVLEYAKTCFGLNEQKSK